MMNEHAIQNINNIIQTEITAGHSIIGVISVDEAGFLNVCWRTDDLAKGALWEQALKDGIRGGGEHQIRSIAPKV